MSIHIHIGKGSKYYDAPDCEDGDEECFKMYEEKRHKEDCMDITKKCEQEKEELMRQNEQLKDNDGMLSQALAGKTTEIDDLKRKETQCNTQLKILTQKATGLEETLRRVSPSSVLGDIARRS
jgi:chromosome segregation ATPase